MQAATKNMLHTRLPHERAHTDMNINNIKACGRGCLGRFESLERGVHSKSLRWEIGI